MRTTATRPRWQAPTACAVFPYLPLASLGRVHERSEERRVRELESLDDHTAAFARSQGCRVRELCEEENV